MRLPHFIGIAGASCSGKTSLAHGLADRLDASVTILPMDAYYRVLSEGSVEERARYNFDAPEAIEHELLDAHLRRLAAREAVEHPIYDYSRHLRASETCRVAPADFVVLEGLFALYWAPVRALLATKIFVDAPDALCLSRRMERDIRERGRTPDSVERQYAGTVRPMYVQFCAPTRHYADLVLDGARCLDLNVESVLRLLSG